MRSGTKLSQFLRIFLPSLTDDKAELATLPKQVATQLPLLYLMT